MRYNRKVCRLPNRLSAFKNTKLTNLCKKLWRNTHMSAHGSPALNIFSRRKARGTDKFRSRIRHTCSETSTRLLSGREDRPIDIVHDIDENRTGSHEAELSDDKMDYVIFPNVSNNRDEAERLLYKEVKGRRPLHNTEPNEVVGGKESNFGKSPTKKDRRSTTLRYKSEPYRSPKRKPSSLTDSDGDAVEFLGEIQTRNSLPSMSTTFSRLNLDTNTSTTYSRSTGITGCRVETSKIENIRTMKSVWDNTSTLRLKDNLDTPNSNFANDSLDVSHRRSEANITFRSRRPQRPLKEHDKYETVELTDGIDEEDDLVVVQSDQNDEQEIDILALKKIVICVVSHFAEENDIKDLTLEYVLNRLKALYHKDFSHRTRDIKYFIRRALKRCQSLQMHKEVRPGVRESDINTLSSENWLNDVIINQYMTILVKDKSKFGAISSFWYEESCRGKVSSLPNNWERLKSILAPTCVDAHWSLLRYYPRTNSVDIYSSLPVTRAEIICGQTLLGLFSNKLNGGKKGRCYSPSSLPQQENEHDCGVYVCMFARCVVYGNTLKILPQQVCEFREWLKKEIVSGQLLG